MDWGGHLHFLFAADFDDKSAKISEIRLRGALRRTGLRDIPGRPGKDNFFP
jgi:hypothetical protein